MRIKVGQVVNSDADVNLADLKPLDRITTAAINAYHNTNLYRRRFAEDVERQEERRRSVRQSLVDDFLSIIAKEIEQNSSLQERGDECSGVLVLVPARFKDLLSEALESHELDAYDSKVISPTSMLAKYTKAPTLVYFTQKGG